LWSKVTDVLSSSDIATIDASRASFL